MAILIPGQTTSDFYNILSSDGGASNISITQAGPNQLLGHKTLTIPTAGTYVPDDIEVRVEARVNVGAGSLSNQVASADENNYTDNSANAPVLISGSYLYIHEGWFPNQKISLAKLVPDIADQDEATDAHILAGFKAWDEDGRPIIGALQTVTPTFSGGTVTATAGFDSSAYVQPSVTVAASGSFAGPGASVYGVTPTQPTGQDGTNYLTIDSTGTAHDGNVTATANASSSDVLWYQGTVGNISETPNTTAYAGQSATQVTSQTQITPAVVDSFSPLYIPIVSPVLKGGAVTQGNTTSTVAVSAIGVPVTQTGSFTTTGVSSYGVTTTTPTGTDGTDYLTLDIGHGTVTGGAISGAVSIAYTKSAVQADGDFKGAVSINDDDTFISAVSNGSFTSDAVSGTATVNVTGETDYYVPITTVSINQPSLSVGTITITPDSNDSFSVTPSTSITDSLSAAITESNYGISDTAPSGSYLILNPEAAASGSIGVDASGTVTLDAGSVTYGSGLVEGGTDTINGGSQSCTGTTTMSASTYVDVAAGNNKYVKIVTPTAAVSFDTGTHTASVNATTTAEFDTTTGNTYTSGPTLYNDAASAGSSYIKITSDAPDGNVNVTATPSFTTDAGITTAQTGNGTGVTCQTTVSVTATDKYMKVYTGGGATWA